MASYVDVDTMSEDDICTYLQENKISDDGVQSVDELRQLVKLHMERFSKSHNAKDYEGHDKIQQTRYVVMADMLATDKVKRLDLIQLYEEVKHIHMELDTSISLKKENQDNIKEIDGYIRDLEDKKCYIVVAGEVGSGKSSFLNLLLGQEIFPTSHLPWTSAICFLHNSDRQSMVLDGNQNINLPDLKTLIEQMEKYACHNRITRQRQCQTIDIYWPVPILPENVVLVDVPGIGENPDMDKMVLDYISKALICIYVVFSSNAGGVQEDKLKMILRHRFQSSDEEGVMNLLEHTLFVCNQWDEVEASGEENNVWNTILEQLKSCIKVLNEDSVVKISVKEAARNLKIGLEDTNAVKDFKKTLRRFEELLQKSLSAKTTYHSRIIATQLRKTGIYLANFQKCVDAEREEQKKEQMNTIISELSSMETKTTEFFNDIKKILEQGSKNIASKLHAFLHSKNTVDRLLNCNNEDDPSSPNLSSDKTVQVYMYQQRAKAKLERVIEEWEEQEKIIAGVQKEVQQKLQEFVSQNLNVVQVITLDDAPQQEQLPEQWFSESSTQEDPPLPLEGKIIIGLTSPLWIPLGLAVGIIGLVIGGPIALAARALKCAIVCRRFSNNEFQHMLYHLMEDIEEQMTLECVRKLVEQNYMLTLFTKIETLVNQIFENTLHKKMLKIIANYDQRSSQQIHDSIGKAKSDLSQIYGRLKVYELLYMLPDLIIKDNIVTDKRIGEGQFSIVYKSSITNQGTSRDVAMKKFKRPIQPESVFEQLSELHIFRVLKHTNIVEYFGVHIYSGEASGSDKEEKGNGRGDSHSVYQPSWENVFGKRLAIFLELCDESLEQYAFITYRLQNRLQSDGKASALAHFQTILRGICSGLVCIHDKGFMHRDLKLLNVLICNGVPKITDFGVSRECDLSHNTMAGTFTHMSPEMLAHKTYSKPTDIYSMAILMWEFWYGRRSFTEFGNISIIELGKKITTGSRPSLSAGVQMPNGLQDLVTACWDGDPDKRPTASKLLERLQICFS